jgi:hypothetical protein
MGGFCFGAGGIVAAWYLTKEGRAEFGRRARERDANWWKKAEIWVGVEDDHDPVMVAACDEILHQCPGAGEFVRAYAEGEVEVAWRGVDFQQLRDKAVEPPEECEDFDREYRAIIREAHRILKAREQRLMLPAPVSPVGLLTASLS